MAARGRPLRTFSGHLKTNKDRSFVYTPGTVPNMPYVDSDEVYGIDVSQPYSYRPPTSWEGVDFDELSRTPLYHSSRLSKDQFMQAPFLHLGSKSSADFMGPSMHGFRLNKFSSLHPEVFKDDIVNEAHSQILEERGIAVPTTVHDSRMGYVGGTAQSKIDRVKDALTSNQTVVYDNSTENLPYWHPLDRRRLSFIVPTPSMNLVGMRQTRQPHPSPPLPLDYSEMTEGPITKKMRKHFEHGYTHSDPVNP